MLLARAHPCYGFKKMLNKLKLSGYKWNHKKIYRNYCELKLNLRVKRKKRLPTRNPDKLMQPIRKNICWSIDFMHDVLTNGRKFRTFNVIDDFNRECLGLEIGYSLPSRKVVKFLEQLTEKCGAPDKLRLDNGPEFISKNLRAWAKEKQIILDFIEPGTPSQNAYIERFNRTFRQEVLDMHLFNNLKQVKIISELWVEDYNFNRPHESLKNVPPVKYLVKEYGENKTINLMDNALALSTI
jgi:putative transposase